MISRHPLRGTTVLVGPALDTLAIVETPEGVTLRLAPAGVVPRALALLVDWLGLGVLGVALLIGLSVAGKFGSGVMLIGVFCGQWLYPVLFEVLNDGQTIGKRVLGLQVVHDDGTPVRLPASAVRNLLMVVDLLPGTATVALFSMLIDPRFRRVGDRTAGTMVVYRPVRTRATQFDEVAPLPLAAPLRVEEQQLLVAFAERQDSLSRERATELADLLEPLTGQRGAAGSAILQRLARGIVGGL